ncbi:uncharacterized protein METZ01_LOCUS186946, partial [marine metagenome]
EVAPVEEVVEEVAPVEEVAEEVAPVEEVAEEISPEAEKIFERLEETPVPTPTYPIEEYADGRFSVSGVSPKFLIKNFSKEEADKFIAKLNDNPGSTLEAIRGYARLAKVPVEVKESVAAVEKKVEKIKEEDKSEDLKTAKDLAEQLRISMEVMSGGKDTGTRKKSIKEVKRLAKKLGTPDLPQQFLIDQAKEYLIELEKVPYAQRDFGKVALYKKHIQELEDSLEGLLRYQNKESIKKVYTQLKQQQKDMKETGHEIERGVDLSGNIGNLIRILEFDKVKLVRPVTKENPKGYITLSGAELLRSINAVTSGTQLPIPKGTKVTRLDTPAIRKRIDRFDKDNSALLRRYDAEIERNDNYVKNGRDKNNQPFTDEDGIKAINNIMRNFKVTHSQLISKYYRDAEELGFNASDFLPSIEEQSSDENLKKYYTRISNALNDLTATAGGVEAVFDKKQRSKKQREEKEVLYKMPERLLSGEVIIHQYHPTKAGQKKVLPGYPRKIPAQEGIDKPKGVPVTAYTAIRELKRPKMPPLFSKAEWMTYLGSSFDNRLYDLVRKGKISGSTLDIWEKINIDERVLEISPDITVVTTSDLESGKAMKAAIERIKRVNQDEMNK